MRINVNELSLKKAPEYATETEIIEIQPETKLEKIWNYLSQHYTALDDEKEISQLKKLFEHFYLAGTEIETCKSTFGLIEQNVIKQVKTQKKDCVNEYTLKTKVLQDLIEITQRKKKLLIESIEKESKIYELVKNENVYMKNNRLKIWIDIRHELDCTSGAIKKPENWKPLGLYCKIKYKNVCFKGYYKKNNLNCIEDAKEYIKEIKIHGKYKYNEFIVIIKRGIPKQKYVDNKICNFIIDCIDNNISKDKIHEMLLLYTSKYLLKSFLNANNITKYKTIMDDNKIFCICEIGVVKIYTTNENIKMFLNEKEIDYKTKKLK